MARTVPVAPLQNPGAIVASALWNSGPKAMGDFYTGVPMFRGRQTSAFALGSGGWYVMPLQATDIDTDSGHSNSINSSRYTCQVAGWYWVQGYSAWTNSGAAQADMWCALAVNGTQLPGAQQVLQTQANDFHAVGASALVQLNVGDFVETWGRQDSGSTVSTWIGTDLCPCMNVLWVHE